MTNEEVDEIIKEVDPDLNGYMKYEEFVKDRLDKLKKWIATYYFIFCIF